MIRKTYVCLECTAGWEDDPICPHCGKRGILRGKYRVVPLKEPRD